MDERLKAGHFMRYLGSKAGTPSGGMEAMYAALEEGPSAGTHGQVRQPLSLVAATDAVTSEVDQPSETHRQGVPPSEEACIAAVMSASEEQQGADGGLQAIKLAEGLLSELEPLRQIISPVDLFWKQLSLSIRQLQLSIRKKAAEGGSGHQDIPSELQINKDAPDGWSLLRLKGPLERGRKGRRQPSRTHVPLSQEPCEEEADRAQPFASASQPQRPQTVLQRALSSQTASQAEAAKAAQRRATVRVKEQIARMREACAGTALELPPAIPESNAAVAEPESDAANTGQQEVLQRPTNSELLPLEHSQQLALEDVPGASFLDVTEHAQSTQSQHRCSNVASPHKKEVRPRRRRQCNSAEKEILVVRDEPCVPAIVSRTGRSIQKPSRLRNGA